MHVGLTEIIFVLLLVLLIFGTKKLPSAARSIGKALHEFKKGMRDMKDEIQEDTEHDKDSDSSQT